MTTIPSVASGDPVCHIAFPKKGVLTKASKTVQGLQTDSLHERMRDDLASNVMVTEPEDD
ncbi:MAG: hypothetical protein AAFR96_01895 [Planctomycetota bacterium]